MTSPKPGDVVTAVIDYSSISDHGRHRPFSVTGTVYEAEEHPGNLWVGGQVIVLQGVPVSCVTVVVLVAVPEVVTA